jgi:hypothetical protein
MTAFAPAIQKETLEHLLKACRNGYCYEDVTAVARRSLVL